MAVVLRRSGLGISLLVALLALGLGALAYRAWFGTGEALPTGSLVTGFQRQNELTVFAAQVVAVPTSRIEGMIDLLDREETAIIPANVRYTVDLSRMNERSLQWNAAGDRLTITAPPVIVQRPELREDRARYYRKGLLVGGDAVDRLRRSNSVKAGREALALARNAELMALAQNGARDAITGNARLLLSGGDRADAEVVVRFATDGARAGEQMDHSRALQDVLGNRN